MSNLNVSVVVPVWMKDATGTRPHPHDWAKMTISNGVKAGEHSEFLVLIDVLMPGTHNEVRLWVARMDLEDALKRVQS